MVDEEHLVAFDVTIVLESVFFFENSGTSERFFFFLIICGTGERNVYIKIILNSELYFQRYYMVILLPLDDKNKKEREGLLKPNPGPYPRDRQREGERERE